MLFVHGAFAGGWCFDNMAGHFTRRGWRCIAPDLRHHDGALDAAGLDALGNTGLSDYFTDLAAIIAGLGELPVVVGHSMGGLLAQQLAASNLARAAILLAPAAPWGLPSATASEIGLALGLLRGGMFWNQAIHPDRELASALAFDRLAPDLRQRAVARLVPESGRALFEIMYWAVDWRQASAVEAARVTCPVLCLVGAADTVISPATVRAIASRYATAAFREVDALGHFIFGEPGEPRLIALCETWLAEYAA
jgi:pimeloyl-ACP methyl ester carboxylesterase